MLFRKYLICIFLLIPFTSFADQYRAKVIKVIDGDTIWVKSENKHIKIIPRKENILKQIDIVIVFAFEYFEDIKKKFKGKKINFYKPIPFKKL